MKTNSKHNFTFPFLDNDVFFISIFTYTLFYFLKLSFSDTERLNTGFAGVLSLSAQK